MDKINIIIDCDPGTDDAIALMLAAGSKELALQAVTTVAGNRPVTQCTENALKVLECCHRTDITVASGSKEPLARPLDMDDIYSGRDGMAETFLPYKGTPAVAEDAVELMGNIIRRHAGNIHIVSIAPMTNIARAFLAAPSLIPMVSSIITINGAYGTTRKNGIYNSRTEWNVMVDPEAAKVVLESGVPIYAMGVDVTSGLEPGIFTRLLEGCKEGTLPRRFLEDAGRFLRSRGLEPHGIFVDAMAVAYVLRPQIAKFICGKARVETKGECTTGMTVFDNVGHISNQSLVYAACEYDWRELEQLLASRVFV